MIRRPPRPTIATIRSIAFVARCTGAAMLELMRWMPPTASVHVAGNPHVSPSEVGDGPCTAVRLCLAQVCKLAGIIEVTPHTSRRTFGSMAGEFGFSELIIRAMLGHASQSVTQDYIHIDEALKLACDRTSGEIERLLAERAAKLKPIRFDASSSSRTVTVPAPPPVTA